MELPFILNDKAGDFSFWHSKSQIKVILQDTHFLQYQKPDPTSHYLKLKQTPQLKLGIKNPFIEKKKILLDGM